MRLRYCIVLAAGLLTAAGPDALALDLSKVDCRAFLASGQDNMAVMIMFLRGYHAGRTGTVAYDSAGPYPARLGRYCRDHPVANLIEASEQILGDLDRGI